MPSTGTPTRDVVVARGPQDLLDLVPFRLGFHPADSLVLLEMRAPTPRRRPVGFALRVDLPATEHPTDVEAACALALRAVALNLGEGSELWILLYDDDVATGARRRAGELVPGPRAAATLAHVRRELTAAGTELGESMLITRQRWRSLNCQESCCPPGGRRLRPGGAITAEAIGLGLVAAPDRASSLPTTTPVDDERLAAADRARRGEPLTLEQARASWRQALTSPSRTALPSAEWCGRMLTALADVPVRDALLLDTPERDEARTSSVSAALAIDVARHGRGAEAAGAWAAAAWWEWNSGRSPRAQHCAEQALRLDPEHRLATLVRSALLAALPPRS